jgi:hypothetical protein
MFPTEVAEREKKMVLCSVTFCPRKPFRLWENVEKYGTARQATHDDIMLHRQDAMCLPDNEGKSRDTQLAMFNTSCFVIDYAIWSL